ncbi:MAG: metabolite traffic protein EboE [Nodularia sp. CChRGM 3473]
MKINNFHLTYCTNIHPGEEWEQVFANLKQYIPPLKARLAPDKPFGIGLRLAAVAAKKLLQGNTLIQFQSWLTEQGLYVFTLNGFPYGKFHQGVVKDQVYAPDWSKQERLDYTLQLTNILAELLPTDTEGSISTLPLSYKPWFAGNQLHQSSVMDSASLQIAQVVAKMVHIRNQQGKLLHLDLEPEPDGLIENADEVIDYFQNHLLPIGGAYLVKHLGISPTIAESYLLDHVRICYDTCHFAVEYENPISVFQRLQNAGIQIGKIQISAALQVNLSEDTAQRRLITERLKPFAESTYLHQVIARDRRSHALRAYRNSQLIHYPDLETALPHLENTNTCEWRIHFHVPIFIRDYQLLHSTQDDIITVLELLHNNHNCTHLEIETYTWEVLPEQIKLDLLASIQREYEWVQTKLLTKQLVPN